MKKIIIAFFLFPLICLAQKDTDFRIITSDENTLIFEFIPNYTDRTNFGRTPDGQILPLFENALSAKDEKNTVYDYRYRAFLIGLPGLTGNSVKLISSEFTDIQGVSLKKRFEYKNEAGFAVKSDKAIIAENIIPEIVKIGETGIFREKIAGILEIHPYSYFPNESRIRIYKKMTIKVTFGQRSNNLKYGRNEDQIYDNLLNYNVARNWIYKENERLTKQAKNSVLSSGKWFRIKINEEGIYKLDFNYLKNQGIDPTTIDPRKIKIYGNGGRVLAENVNNNNQDDLSENAIYVSGENDGKFDQGDFILFYGTATKGFNYSGSTKTLSHFYNYYSDFNYYWLTTDGSNGKRMQLKQSLNQSNPVQVNTTTGVMLTREFKKNLIGSGKEWAGDNFTTSANYRVYNNRLSGLIPNQTVTYRIHVISRSNLTSYFSFELNSVPSGRISLPPVELTSYYNPYAMKNSLTLTGTSTLPENRSILRINYEAFSQTSEGWLNYFEILYPRYLLADNDKFVLFPPDTSGTLEYKIGGFSNSDIMVFDVTDFKDVKMISGTSSSGSEVKFQSQEKKDSASKYYAVGLNGYLTPIEMLAQPNQNLHGISDGAKMVIISPKEFLSEAERLKTQKNNRKNNPISAIVINIDEIYNEFSGGIPDISAVRDFLKYAYNNWNTRPYYVLLFGDGNYDYKNIEGYGKNYVPPYETMESLDYINTYTTDDYFAWVNGQDVFCDLAVGRINAQSKSEAKIAVDKIINYENNSQTGEWTNKLTFVADDGKNSGSSDDGALHTGQSEDLEDGTPDSYSKSKIYLVMYPTTETSLGRRKPDVNKAIVNAINDGTLVMNFIGHGNPDVWTYEYVFEKATTIPQLTNKDKLFFLSAATCDFGNYDNPANQSSTELLVLKENGGAIAAFTSSRIVWSNENAAINKILFSNLFNWRNTNAPTPSLGSAYLQTKLLRAGTNDQKYHLFGDPSIYLLYPRINSKIDSIDNKPATSVVAIKTLTETILTGSVVDSTGKIRSDFNGIANITVYDTKKRVEVPEWPYMTLRLEGGIVFAGRSQIKNGRFSAKFTVPKDVSYENNTGKILVFYGNDSETGLGYTSNIKIVAADSVTITDKTGPKIRILFDNNESFNANLVNQSPLLIVKLEDDYGINSTGTGLGHQIEAVLNNDIYNPVDLSKYFVGELDQGNKVGEIKYRFNKLEPGTYNLKITAWDIFNNSTTEETDFEVISDGNLEIKDVYNYPNPFKDFTTFTFQHSYASYVDIKIKIYTISGRLIHTIERNHIAQKFVLIDWDGRDGEGDLIGNGLYLYKIILKTIDSGTTKEAIGKLLIIR